MDFWVEVNMQDFDEHEYYSVCFLTENTDLHEFFAVSFIFFEAFFAIDATGLSNELSSFLC